MYIYIYIYIYITFRKSKIRVRVYVLCYQIYYCAFGKSADFCGRVYDLLNADTSWDYVEYSARHILASHYNILLLTRSRSSKERHCETYKTYFGNSGNVRKLLTIITECRHICHVWVFKTNTKITQIRMYDWSSPVTFAGISLRVV